MTHILDPIQRSMSSEAKENIRNENKTFTFYSFLLSEKEKMRIIIMIAERKHQKEKEKKKRRRGEYLKAEDERGSATCLLESFLLTLLLSMCLIYISSLWVCEYETERGG